MTTSHDTQNATLLRFSDAVAAVDAAPDLTTGVRKNLVRAVHLAAQLTKTQLLDGPVDIAELRARLTKLTPAMLGFAHSGSLASFKSSLNRALRLAGLDVMPSKTREPLLPGWQQLRQVAEPKGFWPALSRFAGWCSQRRLDAAQVTQEELQAFGAHVTGTSLKLQGEHAIRQCARAWQLGQRHFSEWPLQVLALTPMRKASTTLSWSAYPTGLWEDVRAFIGRGGSQETDWLDDAAARPLQPATQRNYAGALLRAAGELADAGVDRCELKCIRDLVRPDRARLILRRIAERSGRKQGGGIALTAAALAIAADWAGVPASDRDSLRSMVRRTAAPRRMGDRTFQRLVAIDDDMLDRLLLLPARLLRDAAKRPGIDLAGARLVRCALFLSLLFDTGARQGNIVGLRFGQHLVLAKDDRECLVSIAGHEVKNGSEIFCPLRPETVKLLRVYRDRYRPLHGPADTAWLFPRADGSHWSGNTAAQTLQQVILKYLGVVVNPHLIRALIGAIVERAAPGAVGITREVLGHRQTATTEAYYMRQQGARARGSYHGMLAARLGTGRLS